ncbi:MAG: carboxy terminal-processing peptidase [Verrucomicrobiales bacterium]
MPSVNDLADYGEESLENPLPWETIDPATYEPARTTPLPFKDLQARTTSRIGTDQEFKYVAEDMDRYKERKERNEISLNRAERESESKELEAIRVAREDERIKRFAETREKEKDLFKVYSLTQDNVRDEKLTLRADLSNEAASGMMTKPKKRILAKKPSSIRISSTLTSERPFEFCWISSSSKGRRNPSMFPAMSRDADGTDHPALFKSFGYGFQSWRRGRLGKASFLVTKAPLQGNTQFLPDWPGNLLRSS